MSSGHGKVSVLYLSSSSGPGGAEQMLCSLAASLDRTRFRPIVGLFRPGWLKEQCEQQGIETHVFPVGGMLHGAWISACTRLVREERVALIHTHEFDANVHGTLVAAITGVPIVATVHGKHYYWTKFRRRVAYRFVSRFATMVAVSQNLKDFLGQKVGIDQTRIRVIYNGVNPSPEFLKGNILGYRAELGIPEGDQIVGVVGSLYPVKGHRFLIEAIPHVLAKFQRTTFLFIGRGELELDLKEHVQKLGIEKKVLFLGLRQDVPRLLSLMDVFALPSLSEGLSMAILEAMTAGKPVVTTRVGGNSELVLHLETGVLVPPEDSRALAEGLERVLGDNALAQRMGLAGRRRAAQYFGLHTMVKNYEMLYQGSILQS